MKVGKLPPKLLSKYVLSRIGFKDPNVIVGPTLGEDAAIIGLGNGNALIIHTDPITEAVKRIGWLAINIASNDLGVRGVRPKWFSVVILLPQNATEKILDEITKQIDTAAKSINAMVVGGHTEVSPGITKPIVIVTAIGISKLSDVVTSSGAHEGDLILMTKGAGLEGTAIIASDFRNLLIDKGVPMEIIKEAETYFNQISILPESLELSKRKVVTAMHDPTEGGLINGLIEISQASDVGIEVYEDKIIVRRATKVITSALNIDPLKLISSGALIATIRKDKVSQALNTLAKIGVEFSIIGKVTTGKGVKLIRKNGSVEYYEEFVEDEISKLWSD